VVLLVEPVAPVEVVVVVVVVVPPHGPQTPAVLPTGRSHVNPAQQSALTVHAPHWSKQLVAPQT